jgi:haloalkane dehalogenase
MSDWLIQLDLSGVTVFLQDWGSLIGLRLVAAFPERFAGVVVAKAACPWLRYLRSIRPLRKRPTRPCQ